MQVTSGWMAPTVKPGDWIAAQDLGHDGRRAVACGEVVLCSFPLGTTGRAVKRVVAVGGDRVAVSARSLSVNGRTVPVAGAPSATAARARVETVPPGQALGGTPSGSSSTSCPAPARN